VESAQPLHDASEVLMGWTHGTPSISADRIRTRRHSCFHSNGRCDCAGGGVIFEGSKRLGQTAWNLNCLFKKCFVVNGPLMPELPDMHSPIPPKTTSYTSTRSYPEVECIRHCHNLRLIEVGSSYFQTEDSRPQKSCTGRRHTSVFAQSIERQDSHVTRFKSFARSGCNDGWRYGLCGRCHS